MVPHRAFAVFLTLLSNVHGLLQFRSQKTFHFPSSSRIRIQTAQKPRKPTQKNGPFALSLAVHDFNNDCEKIILSMEKNSAIAKHALLISSFNDHVKSSPDVKAFLREKLIYSVLSEDIKSKEAALEKSVEQSPCNGPNIELLNDLEKMDEIIQSNKEKSSFLDPNTKFYLKFLYIPTAMLAYRPESLNSPGKQRQRARADAKKRRNDIIKLLHELFDGYAVDIIAITLDFSDGSLKHPEGSCDETLFPMNGKEAFTAWNPNFIFVEGGNTFWLSHCMEQENWKSLLLNACTGPNYAVYCGKSAGAIVAGKFVHTACWKRKDDPSIVTDKEEYNDWKGIRGLGMFGDISVFPHMDENWESVVKAKVSELRNTSMHSLLVTLRDSDVLYIDDGIGIKQSLES